MIQTIIIDDSLQAIDYLTGLLEKSGFDIRIVGTATNVADAIRLIDDTNPDLVFLDIELGDQTGFDLLKQVNKIKFRLIFTTGYNQYALDAFQFNAVHYLLKPIQINELNEALSRISIKNYKLDSSLENIKSLLESFKESEMKKIPLSTEEGIRYVNPSDILYIKADGSYSVVKLNDGTSIMLSRLLKEFEMQLPGNRFFRVSKSFLINMQFVSMYRRLDGGTVEMSDGTLISIPRRKKDDFLTHMTQYMK
jgi:two-component system LytT family response regulator